MRLSAITIIRILFLCGFCLAALLITSRSGAEGSLKVDESKIVVLIAKEPAEVQLPISTSTAEFVSSINLELLDPRNEIVAKADKVETIRQNTTVSIPLPFYVSRLKDNERRNLPWLRLRYRVTDQTSTTTLTSGIVSLSQVAPELFEVRVAQTGIVKEGVQYGLRVQTFNPATKRPVAGVRIFARATLEHNDNDLVLQAFGNTDSAGYANLTFQIPPRFPEYPHEFRPSGGELYIDAQKGSLKANLDTEILVDQFPNILITPDKPIYQPGQTLHARALVYTPSRKPLANMDVVFQVRDENDSTVFRSTLKTSRFGVVSGEWSIPDNAKLGDYMLSVSFPGTDDYMGRRTIRVSRYDLPNFSVKVAPDRRFYLPCQNAEVRVNADYLFGQPVSRGRVRVVRENDRNWNYEEQKWEIDEGETYEGELDASGTFLAKIDLKKYFEDLADSADYNRFDDITFAAYLTDPSTNRTEQRQFDIRVTKEQIHAYVVTNTYRFDETGKVPIEFFVSTFYADGSPAQCTVDVEASANGGTKVSRTTIKTNRLGFGKVNGLPGVKRWETEDLDITLTATDRANKRGTSNEDLNLSDEPQLSIQTNKSIYRPGEPIVANFRTNFDDKDVVVHLTTEKGVVEFRRVRPLNNHFQITFPFRREFKDKVGIVASPDFPKNYDYVAGRSVLYPQNQQLDVAVSPLQKSYRPGESAQVEFRVAAPRNSLLESALGVVVVDQAVDERARTDGAFGRRYSNQLDGFLGNDEQVGGVTLNRLRRLDMSKPVPRDLELVAEVILQGVYSLPMFSTGESYEQNVSVPFTLNVSTSLSRLKDALINNYDKSRNYPREETTLRRILTDAGVDFDKVRDPWGVAFRPTFRVDRYYDRMELVSAGPDKLTGTTDDYTAEVFNWQYFQPIGEAIDKAVREYHKRTGKFIRDRQTLNTEVEKLGVQIKDLRDRWGTPYEFKFEVSKVNYRITVESAGPDRSWTRDQYWKQDDFSLWTNAIDYFTETRAKIGAALDKWTIANNEFPYIDAQFNAALKYSEIDFSSFVDPWGRPYQAKFRAQTTYSDRIKVLDAGQVNQQKVEVTPVTRQLQTISVMSLGEDGKPSFDDFEAASYRQIVSEKTAASAIGTQFKGSIIMADGGGAVAGFITDPNSAAVGGARVSVSNGSQTVETTSRDDGSYSLTNLAVGTYQVTVEAVGFKRAMIEGVIVTATSVTSVNVVLSVGASTETVTVTSSAPLITTRQIENLPLISRNLSMQVITKSGTNQSSFTPRLREYFPETLLWQPELITDKQGRALLNFKLADNITTWKLSVIGSNENGEVGAAQTEIRSFQPFFAELDPPRVLTEGDQISLPVVLRNYLERKQNIDLEIKPASWFTLLEGNRKRAEIPAGDSARQTFDLKAIASIKDGKQRVTAIGADSSDAIERVVTVHPDGEEKSETVSEVLNSATSLSLNIPQDVIANSARVELKLYPNLLTHVWESVEGIMQRPYGCAEQTISSAYPSLLVMQFQKDEKSPLRTRARRYVENGYQKLLNFQNSDGGFSYWSHDKSDIALTAYALRFLDSVSTFVPVDPEVAQEAREWLIEQQRKDGSWHARVWIPREDHKRDVMLTALVARSLIQSSVKKSDDQAAIKLALKYLEEQSRQIDEPYLLATYSLLATDAGQTTEAARANERLKNLFHSEAGTSYWQLETNTPFYGWGLAGRIETTALALQALMKSKDAANEKLEASALLFLLRKKDQYGVWYSTQATVNVLEAMLSFLTNRAKSSTPSLEPKVELMVNGEKFKTISLPTDKGILVPQSIDISGVVKAGVNRIELHSSESASTASVQVVSNYYSPWKTLPTTNEARVQPGDSEALRLQTSFSKYTAKVMEEITCNVKVERIGFRGYGMMLAEIGLPPGVDVDRASLENAMTASDWSISQYDVLPDRVVVYLWPRAGGSEFSFKFKPRFPMTAKSAASTIYDYYNPEARASVAPRIFTVK